MDVTNPRVAATQFTAYMALLDERFRDKGEGARLATTLANQLMDYAIEMPQPGPYLWGREGDVRAAFIQAQHRRRGFIAAGFDA